MYPLFDLINYPKASMARMTRMGAETLRILSCLDEMEKEYYKNCGFELKHGDFRAENRRHESESPPLDERNKPQSPLSR